MICRTFGVTHATCLTFKIGMMVDLGNIMVMVKDQGHEFNLFTLRPCDGREDSSWWSLRIVQNPKGLMHIGEKVCHFDEVLFEGGSCSANTLVLRLFGLTLSLAVR